MTTIRTLAARIALAALVLAIAALGVAAGVTSAERRFEYAARLRARRVLRDVVRHQAGAALGGHPPTARELPMPKFMVTGSYTRDSAAAIKEGGGAPREAAARALAASVGGTLESFYFAFGEWDFAVIADLPDMVAAAALAAAVAGSGSMDRFVTTVLLTPADMDAASRTRPTYTPPGG